MTLKLALFKAATIIMVGITITPIMTVHMVEFITGMDTIGMLTGRSIQQADSLIITKNQTVDRMVFTTQTATQFIRAMFTMAHLVDMTVTSMPILAFPITPIHTLITRPQPLSGIIIMLPLPAIQTQTLILQAELAEQEVLAERAVLAEQAELAEQEVLAERAVPEVLVAQEKEVEQEAVELFSWSPILLLILLLTTLGQD
jgi:hypothetical protein